MEGGGNLWIKLNDIATLADYIAVALLNLILDPFGELNFQHRRTNVTNPLLRSLVDFLLIGEVLVDFLMATVYELGNLLDGEALVLWNSYVPDVLALDDCIEDKMISNAHAELTLLCPGHDVFQEVDCDLVVFRDVEAAVNGDEVIDFSL